MSEHDDILEQEESLVGETVLEVGPAEPTFASIEDEDDRVLQQPGENGADDNGATRTGTSPAGKRTAFAWTRERAMARTLPTPRAEPRQIAQA